MSDAWKREQSYRQERYPEQLELQLNKVEERVRQVEQYKSKLMGMIVVVGGAVGLGIASLLGLLDMYKD